MSRRSAMPTMPMPVPWTDRATRSLPVSRLRLLLILAGMIAAGAVIAWWLRHQHMSPLRLYVLGGLVVTLLVWAGMHYRHGGRLVVKGIEWALVFSLAVALTGATAADPTPLHPAPKGKAGAHKQVTARENPSPANLRKSAEAYCRKLPACRDLLEWYSKRLGSESAKAGKPDGEAKG